MSDATPGAGDRGDDGRTEAQQWYERHHGTGLTRLTDYRWELPGSQAIPGSGETWETQFASWFERNGTALLDTAARDVLSAFTDLGFPARRLDNVIVRPLVTDEMTARLTSHGDGSRLVLVSDMVAGLCMAFASQLVHAVVGFSGRWAPLMRRRGPAHLVVLGRIIRIARRDPALPDAAFTGLLRFCAVVRRVYGVSMPGGHRDDVGVPFDLGDPRGAFLQLALRFMVAHEIAHDLLGHLPGPQGSHRTSADETFVAEDEAAADTLALLVAAECQVQEVLSWETPGLIPRHGREAGEFLGTLGALLSMLAVSAADDAFYVRRGRSHPSARDRAQWLIEEILGEKRLDSLNARLGRQDRRVEDRFGIDRRVVPNLVIPIARAVAAASDFAPTASGFDWSPFVSAEHLERPPASGLARARRHDRLMTASDEVLLVRIGDGADRASDLAIAGRLAADGRIREALSSLCPGTTTARLLDPDQALAFPELVHLALSVMHEGVLVPPPDDDVDIAVATATLLARRLQWAAPCPSG